MTVQELLNVLNNKYEIPDPTKAELCFYYTDKEGKEINLKLNRMGAFSISTDITIGFIEDEDFNTIKPLEYLKDDLK